MERTITTDLIQQEYDKGKAYKEGLGLYEKVRQNERFFEGDQWNGLKSREIRPVTMNFISRIGLYKVSQIVSDDVGQQIEPFLPDEAAQTAAKVLSQSIDRVVERQKIKSRHRELLRDAFVDGDAALYFYFDADAPTGLGGTPGEIQAEGLMNTNVIFGNPYSRETQKQPYIILVRRRPVSEARREAKRNGVPDFRKIESDGGEGMYKGDDEQTDSGNLCTELTRFWKSEDGFVRWCRCIGRVMTVPETETGMRMYPVAYFSWEPRKNSYHGVREMDALINTQISINKQWTALDWALQNNAIPKLVYNKQKFPNGWDPAARTIGIMGDPKEAITGVAGSMPLPTEATSITRDMMDTAKSCAGVNDAALGNIKNPDNTSAIVAVQEASAAPLSLTRLSYYQFVEDYTRVLIDMMHAFYGVRQVKITDKNVNEMTGEATSTTEIVDYDFSALPVDALDLNIEVGAASYWSKTLQISTLDNLHRASLIPDPIEYLERVPDGIVADKTGLIDAFRRIQRTQEAQNANAV